MVSSHRWGVAGGLVIHGCALAAHVHTGAGVWGGWLIPVNLPVAFEAFRRAVKGTGIPATETMHALKDGLTLWVYTA